MKDVTDILIQLLSTLIGKGFELPIYIFMVSQNGNVVAARYEGDPSKEKPKVHIFVEHIEDPDWKLPINCFFVDGKGKSESVKIDPESFADGSESIH
ncbi:MAG TPA: hypothetical protein VMW32_10250 [Bacteroidales bacterium]|jgi:hypothetical protein|nr:hypothetical protein [Bacteroidales bacterium]